MLFFPPLLLALGVSAATFTVFDVATDTRSPTVSIVSVRPLGVGSDGTTYEVAAAEPTGDFTVTATVVADGTMNKINQVLGKEGGPQVTINSGCTWGTGKDGVCKAEVIGEDISSATTYSGSTVPLFTVTVDDSSATASPTSTSNSAISTIVGKRFHLGVAVASVLYLL